MKSLARRFAGVVPIAMIVLAAWSGAPSAQTSDKPATSGDTADQFKSGAQRIGEGAEKIGEGIKQGAIQTWDAVKAGASAAADKFQGSGSPPKHAAAPPPPPPPPPRPDDAPR
jgi:hypothetical protein